MAVQTEPITRVTAATMHFGLVKATGAGGDLVIEIRVINSDHSDGSAHRVPGTTVVDIVRLVADGKAKPRLEIYPIDAINSVLVRLAEGKVLWQ